MASALSLLEIVIEIIEKSLRHQRISRDFSPFVSIFLILVFVMENVGMFLIF